MNLLSNNIPQPLEEPSAFDSVTDSKLPYFDMIKSMKQTREYVHVTSDKKKLLVEEVL